MTTTAPSRIETKIASSVARIKLINPPLNVIDQQMTRQLNDTLIEMESRADVSTIVFEGDTRAFSAGVDIPSSPA
jgi:enoyl-CoA hydratase/carnithine racemase